MKRHKAYGDISTADAECDECAAGTADVSQADGGADGQQMNTFERIYRAVELIPKGRVASYGVIAALAGNPRMSRIVGYALHVNPDPERIKCHRVVFADGSLSRAFVFGGENEQRALLEAEGVGFLPNGKVDMKKYAVFSREHEKKNRQMHKPCSSSTVYMLCAAVCLHSGRGNRKHNS